MWRRGGRDLRRHAPVAVLLLALILAPGCRDGRPPASGEAAAPPSSVGAEPSAGCRAAPFPALDAVATLSDGGEPRRYYVDAPASAGDRALPVVLSFHGFRSTAWRHRWWTGWGDLARREGFIVVTPDGHEGVELLGHRGRGWDIRPGQTRDSDFVRRLLDHLERERCVDRRRIFATGMSNGGFFANLLGCTLAERMAAVAPVAGGLPLEGCVPARAMPVLFVHGRADRVIPAGMVTAARDWWARSAGCTSSMVSDGCVRYTGCSGEVVYCEGPQAHRWPADATARIWRFFGAHPRG